MTNVKMLGLLTLLFLVMSVSVAYAYVDVSIEGISVTPSGLKPNSNGNVVVDVKNLGNETANNVLVSYTVLREGSSFASGNTTIALAINETQTRTFSWTSGDAGTYTITGNVSVSGDTNTSNDNSNTEINLTDTYSIENLSVTKKIFIDKNGFAKQDITVNGFAKKNENGINNSVFIYMDGQLKGYLVPDETNSGYFSEELKNLYFSSAGNYDLAVKIQEGSTFVATKTVSFEVLREGTSSDSNINYNVDVVVTPAILQIDPGETASYKVKVRNIGDKSDTYDIDVSSSSVIKNWITVSRKVISVDAGKSKELTIWVDAPSGADPRTYFVSVEANGKARDQDEVDLIVRGSSNDYDINIGSIVISPNRTTVNTNRDVAISAPVSFHDSSRGSGDYVTIKLYIGGNVADTKKMFFYNGETDNVKFYSSARDTPINNMPGEYEVYMYAVSDQEVDRSESTYLTVTPKGNVIVTTLVSSVEVSQNDDLLEISLKLTNNDYKQNTYAVYMQGDITSPLTPNSVTVAAGETRIVTLTANMSNVVPGNYSVRIFIENANMKTYTPVSIKITEPVGGSVQENNTTNATNNQTSGNQTLTGGILSGFFLVKTGGDIAGLIGLLLIIAIVGLYAYTNKDKLQKKFLNQKNKEGGKGGEESTDKTKPDTSEGSTPIIAMKSDKVEEKTEKRPFDLTTLADAKKGTVAREEQEVTREVTTDTREAAHVLKNLPTLKSEFDRVLDEARDLRKQVENIEVKTVQRSDSETTFEPAEGTKSLVKSDGDKQTAARVLKDLDKIKEDFHITVEEAKNLKRKISDFSEGFQRAVRPVTAKVRKAPTEKGLKTPKNYLERVADSV